MNFNHIKMILILVFTYVIIKLGSITIWAKDVRDTWKFSKESEIYEDYKSIEMTDVLIEDKYVNTKIIGRRGGIGIMN